jgi:hypothetical protein
MSMTVFTGPQKVNASTYRNVLTSVKSSAQFHWPPVVTQSAPPSAVFPWQPEGPLPPGWIVREREEWAEPEPPA